LNAKVDLNSDSISLLGQRQALLNAKRSLNTLLARDLETVFEVSPMVAFLSGEELQNYKESYQANNTRLLLNRSNQEISRIGFKSSEVHFNP
jgi:hypothetical protein